MVINSIKKIFLLIIISLIVVGCTDSNKDGNKLKDTYNFSYNEIDLTPGNKFDDKSINEEYEFLELESCAFEGNDKVYKYENIEITSSSIDDIETIYSVYFLNDLVQTNEGVKISDDKELMIEKYGNDYENINNEYKYIKSDVILSFIVENDTIISIEYIFNK